jgi:hypothetical protein
VIRAQKSFLKDIAFGFAAAHPRNLKLTEILSQRNPPAREIPQHQSIKIADKIAAHVCHNMEKTIYEYV